MPTDTQIRDLLVERIDKQHQSVGIVVGVIDSTGRRTVSYGKFDADDKRAVDADTIFEIGSVTKVFTSLLLADMVQRGEVALTDPVAKYLPSGVKMPERNGRQITLEDLATHTVWSSTVTIQPAPQRFRESIRRLLGRAALRILVWVPTNP